MKRMIRSVTMISVITYLSSSAAWSQDKSFIGVRQSAIHIGLSTMNLQDEALNRVIHKGPGLSGEWSLDLPGSRGIGIFELGMGAGFLKSNLEEETSSFRFSGSGGFKYLGSLCIFDPGLHLYLGGKAKAGTAIEYFDNWDESHFYWVTSYNAGPSFRVDYTWSGKGILRVDTDIPIFSLVSRPPDRFLYTQSSPAIKDVLKDLNHDLGLLSLSAYRELELHVKYSFGNSKSIVPAVSWRLQYMSINKDGSARMKYLSQTIGVEFIL